MFGRIGWPELVIIVVMLVVFFGARRLPAIARSLGESVKELRSSMARDDEEPPPGDTEEP